MATPYSAVFDSFLMKVTDYNFLKLSQEDLEEELLGFMKSSIVKFYKSKIDLSDRDDTLKQFNKTLTDFEVEVIATLMVVEYLKPEIVKMQLIRQQLTDADFKIYSQANHLSAISDLYDKMKSEASKLIVDYSYAKGNLGDLK